MAVNRWMVALTLSVAGVAALAVGYQSYQGHKRESAARERLRLSEQALSRFRDAFNHNLCAPIYDGASASFRKAIARSEWSVRCESLRARLGVWRDYQVRLYEIPGRRDAGHTQLEGRASFAQGEFSLTSWWSIKNGRAELLSLCLSGLGETIWVPAINKGVPGPPLLDPPPRDRHPA